MHPRTPGLRSNRTASSPQRLRETSDRAVVRAMVMFDVLVAIKMDLTMTTHPQTDGANEFQNRINRACTTIDAAIRDLQLISGANEYRQVV